MQSTAFRFFFLNGDSKVAIVNRANGFAAMARATANDYIRDKLEVD